MVDKTRCGAYCKRVEFGIGGRKESSEDADLSVEFPRPDPVPEKTRPYFAKLSELRDDLEKLGGAPLPQLSMGMSHDFETAIEEGATIVRVGSAIFGSRG